MDNHKTSSWRYGLLGLTLGAVLTFLALRFTNSSDHPHPTAPTADTTATEAVWTCSMHPQIRQPESGDCAICGMDLIPLENTGSDDPLVLQMTEAAVQLASIRTTVIGIGDSAVGRRALRLAGHVRADERRSSSQVAHVPGRIEKLYVTFTGEAIQKGQKLADLYAPELITAQAELLEAAKLADLSPELVTAARNKLRFWKIPDATIDAIEQAGVVRETFPVFADASGIVTEKRVDLGDYVRRGEPLFVLTDLRKVWVLFEAFEENLAHLKLGDQIEFTTPALPDRVFTARITFIDPVVDPATRTVALRTEVDNPGGLLKPEMLVYGSLLRAPAGSADLLLPKSAVLWTGPRSVVYVKVPNEIPSFEYRIVELGEAGTDYYHIISGLAPGEEVVINGSFAIDAAAQLNNQASMINSEVALKSVAETAAALPDYTATTPELFQDQLSALVTRYLSLKDALIASETEPTATYAEAFATLLEQTEGAMLSPDALAYWQQQQTTLQAHARQITEATELTGQREQFDFLSQLLIRAVKVFGVTLPELYVQHCPMAADNQGADWLSTEQEVLNPYFGDAMLRCGIVEETISR